MLERKEESNSKDQDSRISQWHPELSTPARTPHMPSPQVSAHPHFHILPLLLKQIATPTPVWTCVWLGKREAVRAVTGRGGGITLGALKVKIVFSKAHFWKGCQKDKISSTSLPNLSIRFHNMYLIIKIKYKEIKGTSWMKCSHTYSISCLHHKPWDS